MTIPTLASVFEPKELVDSVLPQFTIDRLQEMIDERSLMNMMFWGDPGVGKTSTAKILLDKTGADVYELNGSTSTGIDDVRELEDFCRTMGLSGAPRVCFIDEGEYLSKNAQAGLRGVIEKYPRTRFIMTANDITKMHKALKSRYYTICFDPLPSHSQEIIKRLLPRYKERVQAAGRVIDDDNLSTILHTEFPDLRRVANRIDFESRPLLVAA